MGKVLLVIVGIILLMMEQSVYAEALLSKKVADIFRTNHYLIKYSYYRYSDAFHPAANEYIKDHRQEVTLIQSGDNGLTVHEDYTRENLSRSMVSLYTNGEGYWWITKGNVKAVNSNYTPVKDVVITHQIGDSENQAKTDFENSYAHMMFAFLPILPERNITYSTQGNEMPLYGLTYSQSGEEKIGDRVYQYEEYTTPEKNEYPVVARYYFSNGKLEKLISIINSASLTPFKEGEKLGAGEKIVEENLGGVMVKMKRKNMKVLTAFDIYELTSDFDEVCLSVPKENTIQDFDPGTMKAMKKKMVKK